MNQQDGSTFNHLVSQSSALRKRGGTNDLFGVPFDCRRTQGEGGGDAMVGKVITTVLIIPRPESTNEKGR